MDLPCHDYEKIGRSSLFIRHGFKYHGNKLLFAISRQAVFPLAIFRFLSFIGHSKQTTYENNTNQVGRRNDGNKQSAASHAFQHAFVQVVTRLHLLVVNPNDDAVTTKFFSTPFNPILILVTILCQFFSFV